MDASPPQDWGVDRRVVLALVAAMMALTVVDVVLGMRLFGVRPDSLLGQLGFENGDRLESVNGLPLTSPEKATEAWTQVKGADHVTVQLQRRGESLKIDYDLK